MADFIIRQIQFNDIGGAMRLSTEQGWNQTDKDWKLLVGNPQNICLLTEDKGKLNYLRL